MRSSAPPIECGRNGRSLRLVLGIPAILLRLTLCSTAAALPPGKAWTPVAQFKAPGHTYSLIPDRMESDSTGIPLIIANARGGIGPDMLVLRWADTTWNVVAALGHGTKFVHNVASPPGTHYLIWSGLDEIETPTGILSSLVLAQFVDGTITTPDTVTRIQDTALDYSAAVGAGRRWVGTSDLYNMQLFYSEHDGPWREIPIDGSGNAGIALAALDDTTALVVWLGRIGDAGRAAVLRGTALLEVDPPPFSVLGPLASSMDFRRRPSGGNWMTWPTFEDHVGITTFKDGHWSAPESLTCAYRLPEGFTSQSVPYMSNDDAEYPVVVWMGLSRKNLLPTVCVCVPTDSGFPVAENLENSDFGTAPVVARDRNGDVWVSWWTEYDGWMYWLHSHTTTTASKPLVMGSGQARLVKWTLSESAPGSWWAILRARKEGSFEEVGRIKAGSAVDMNWADSSAPAGVLRYKVRRECLDIRYQLESEEGLWPPKNNRPLTLARSPGATLAEGRLELTGADVGSLAIRVYDLQGRLVLEQASSADGTSPVTIELGLGQTRTTTGIYFVSVRDAGGKVSNPLKLVLLR